MRFFVISLSFFIALSARAQTLELPTVTLQILDKTLSVEVAHTSLSRSQGLMYRASLDKDNGMLFVFPKAARYSMWMLNTRIPLSVAFIDNNGVILNIANMTPHTKTAHHAAGMAKFALEMNLGWFAAKEIQVGAHVIGLEHAPKSN